MKTVTMDQQHIDMLDEMRGRASRKAYLAWLVTMEHLRRKLDPTPPWATETQPLPQDVEF